MNAELDIYEPMQWMDDLVVSVLMSFVTCPMRCRLAWTSLYSNNPRLAPSGLAGFAADRRLVKHLESQLRQWRVAV